jgi:hypothetical protein
VNVFGEGFGQGAEFPVVEIEEDGRLDAKFLAGACGFCAAGVGEGISGGNFGEFVGALFAFGGDGEVDLDTLAGLAGQDGAHEGFVVGMSGDGEQDAGLRRSCLREESGGEVERSEECDTLHG